MRALGSRIASFINQPVASYQAYSPTDVRNLRKVVEPGDVLLVEGNRRISEAIKFLTQSCWSHASLFVGDRGLGKSESGDPLHIIEADVEKGYAVLNGLTEH